MKTPDIVITAAGMRVVVCLDEAKCACPACIGLVIGELTLRAHAAYENRTSMGHITFADYVDVAIRRASLHAADVHSDRAAEEAAAADVGQGADAPPEPEPELEN